MKYIIFGMIGEINLESDTILIIDGISRVLLFICLIDIYQINQLHPVGASDVKMLAC